MEISKPIGPVDHGMVTTSWDPEGGGTVTSELEVRNLGALLGGVAATGAVSLPMLIKSSAAGRAATAAASAAGVEGAALLRTSIRAQTPWMLAGAAAAGAGLIGTSMLAKHFGSEKTHTSEMARDEYIERGLDDPDLVIGASDDVLGSGLVNAAGLVGVAAGMGAGMYAAAGGSPGVRILGTIGGAIGGLAVAGFGAGAIRNAIND